MFTVRQEKRWAEHCAELCATLTLTKTNTTIFLNVHSHPGPCQIFDIFGIVWAEMVSQPQKSLPEQPDSLLFLLQAQLDAAKVMQREERGGVGQVPDWS